MFQISSNITWRKNTQNEWKKRKKAESYDVWHTGYWLTRLVSAWIQTIWRHLAVLCWSISRRIVLVPGLWVWDLIFVCFPCTFLIPSPCFKAAAELWHRETIHHQFTVITARPLVGHLFKPGDRPPSILPKWQLYSLHPGLSSVGQWDGASLCLNRGQTKGYIWLINEDVAQGLLVVFLVSTLTN